MTHSNAYLEHANLATPNLDEAIDFLQKALPSWTIRGEGDWHGRRWVHIGTDDSYLALSEPPQGHPQKGGWLNHLGFVVDDVAAVRERLTKAGYQSGFPKQVQKHRIRDYFIDAAGHEYEFVQYLSDDPSEKNSYEE